MYPSGYLQGHTDQQQRAQGWRPRNAAGVSCCCWELPSAQASGDTWAPRSAGPCTPSGDAPAAPCPRCSSESLASAAAAAHTSLTGRGRRIVGSELEASVGKQRKCDVCLSRGIIWLNKMSATYPLTHGTCCLRPSISCFTQLSTARYTSSSDGTFRLSLEIRSRTWVEWGKSWFKFLQIFTSNWISSVYMAALVKEAEKTSWPGSAHTGKTVWQQTECSLCTFTSLHSWVSSFPLLLVLLFAVH